MEAAESVACRTYQRGLGVGFVTNRETFERFALEATRDRFRAYFLYFGDKPVAFFLGTLSRNVLYDNFTAYDPDYARYSPGTVLFFHIFERLCADGVTALDFGFGDAWYKAQFGNETSQQTTIRIFAPTIGGVGVNLLRIPVEIFDRAGKSAFRSIPYLRSIKKRWRARAQRTAVIGHA
jgi:CelD/BcsL family acetyltransferase involved in cellulose biosynthesis